MKSSLIKFIEKYKVSKLSDAKLRQIFDKEVDKNDFDKNKQEVWSWFLSKRTKLHLDREVSDAIKNGKNYEDAKSMLDDILEN